MSDVESSAPPARRLRASRKGQPRKFSCQYDGCEKKYSRAEHLARHQLNHNPKQIYTCNIAGCDHTFVRPDLYVRHQKKHAVSSDVRDSTRPRTASSLDESIPDFTPERSRESRYVAEIQRPGDNLSDYAFSFPQHHWSQSTTSPHTPLLGPHQSANTNTTVIREESQSVNVSSLMAPPTSESNFYDTALIGHVQANENFAAWLFERPGSHDQDFNLANLPFFDYSIDISPSDTWNYQLPLTADIVAVASETSRPQQHVPSLSRDDVLPSAHSSISQLCRDQLVFRLGAFRPGKRASMENVYVREDSLMFDAYKRSWPNVTTTVLQNCLLAFWRYGAKQIPIFHQPTFQSEYCHPLLLLAIIAFGACQIVRVNPKNTLLDYRELADLIITNLRWEIFTDDDAHPPIQLWVAQALLLVEYYEKMYATRRLHERAHIHHSSTLTLLRRGSPLVGTSGSDTPPSGLPTRATTPVDSAEPQARPMPSAIGNVRWWQRWARNESMHRVVFMAFQMDSLHAVLFGHESALFPYEIRLPLPCDDALWDAQTPDDLYRLETSFQMHGIGSTSFLEGLKSCLHGHDVRSNHHARMILMAGLLSVGWHIYRREKHLQFLETVPSSKDHDRWSHQLLKAFSHWRQSFQDAIGGENSNKATYPNAAEQTADPTVLFRLANITMHSDIIDCQIFAGLKRLIGRKVTEKDYATVVQRMKSWALTVGARVAMLHSFRLLHETLVVPTDNTTGASVPYTCRTDPSIYRPWTLYLAALTIWTYQQALRLQSGEQLMDDAPQEQEMNRARSEAVHYISCVAYTNLERIPHIVSVAGCSALLFVLAEDFANSEWELLMEASKRLRGCQRQLFS